MATGDPTEYDSTDEGVIESALANAWDDYESGYFGGAPAPSDPPAGGGGGGGGGGSEGPRLRPDAQVTGPTEIRVRADVEWSGERRGVRTVTLDGLQLGPDLRRAVQGAQQDYERARTTPRASSYTATGWAAQLRTLTGAGDRGSRAADRAGLDPSARTLRGWLSGDATPSKANRERISQAYENLATRRTTEAREKASRSAGQAVEMLDSAIRQRYGTTVRFFDLESLELR